MTNVFANRKCNMQNAKGFRQTIKREPNNSFQQLPDNIVDIFFKQKSM